MKYVLTEKFTQDLMELYFGLQRACGFTNNNPTLQQFGYNDNAIRARGALAKVQVEGNTKGGQENHKFHIILNYHIQAFVFFISKFQSYFVYTPF